MKKINRVLLLILILCGIGASYFYFNISNSSAFIYKLNQDYNSFEIDHINFYVHTDISIEEQNLRDALKETKKLGENLYKSLNTNKALSVFITLPGDRAYSRFLDNQTMGMYLPKQHLILINGQYPTEIYSTFVHEYSHFLMNNFLIKHDTSIEAIPAWFWEGVAYSFEYMIMNNIPFKNTTYFTVMPLQELDKLTERNSNTLYTEGFYVSLHLIEQNGISIITELLEETTKSTFVNSWVKLINEPLEFYHEKFKIEKKVLIELEEKNNPNDLISYVLTINKEAGKVNVYTPFSSPSLIKAYCDTEQWELAKDEIDKYEPFITNPGEYIDFARLFKNDPSYVEKLINTGEIYAELYGFDVMVYKEEASLIYGEN